MSQPKVIGPITAGGATIGALPTTGNAVTTLVLIGLGLVAMGLLLLRASRYRGCIA